MQVCMVSPVPPPWGGVARWTALMHEVAVRRNDVQLIQVDSAVRWRRVGDLGVAKRAVGGSVHFAQKYLMCLRVLSGRPDVMHLTTSGSLAAAGDLVLAHTASAFGVPLVYHLRFGRLRQIAAARTLEWRILVLVMRLAGSVIVIVPHDVDVVKAALPGGRVHYVPNPIDSARLPAASSGSRAQRQALFLGWVLPSKGAEDLLQAWHAVTPAGWSLLVAGPAEAAYRRRLTERFGCEGVRFLGELDHEEALSLVARCDLFILPSHSEGFPNVILEAMALGRPIVASSVGAIPEMLRGGCGLLVGPGDVEGLAGAIATMVGDARLREECGRRAREKAQREYAADVVFARYVDIWRSVRRGGDFPGVL